MKSEGRALILTLKVLLTGVILYFLYNHSQLQFNLLYGFIDYPHKATLIFGLCYLMVLFHAWRWYRLNEVQNIKLSFPKTILPTYIAIAFNSVLPGSIGGDFFRLYFVLRKFPTQKSNTVLSILVDRIIGLLGVLLIACLVAPFYFDAFTHNTALFYLLIVSGSVCVISIIVFFAIVFMIPRKNDFLRQIHQYMRFNYFSSLVQSLLNATYMYRNSKLIILESLVMSIATQLLLLLVVWIISNLMGLPPLPAGIYMLALVMGQIANLVPLTPGGLGVGEAAFANIIYLLHPDAVAYATVFFALRILSAVSYLPGVFVGLIAINLSQSNYVKVASVEVS